ncbi:MAG TPA: endonuclease domain-containing protein [Candidatus Limnocylindria bacterium]|jgi:hypothetical protein
MSGTAAAQRRYRESHREEIRARGRVRQRAFYHAMTDAERAVYQAKNDAWKAAHPELVAAAVRRRRLRKYGLTEEMFYEYLDAQEGCCGFCGSPLPEDESLIAIDHDHSTGAYRALLHMVCNRVAGFAEFDDRFVGYLAAS